MTAVEWQTPEWEWVDPQNEQAAAKDAINSFMSTLSDELGARGRSWRSTLYQAAKEQKLRKQLGLLTTEERTQQMMAQQTQAQGGVQPSAQPAAPVEGTGEWMGLSRLQWQRNRKALDDTLTGLQDGSITPARASAQLAMLGLAQQNIDALIADIADGQLDNPLPAEEPQAVPVG